jgi:type IV secretion system protein VirB9
MNRPAKGIAAALLATAATAPPLHAQVVETYHYAEDRIYQVRTGVGITTQIELSPRETVADFSTGFSNGWDLTRRGNVFYLKPRNVDVDTNLVIRTATHSYIFELRVVATNWKSLDDARRDGVQYKVSFDYPAESRFVAEPSAAPPLQLDTRLEPDRRYNTDYDYATTTRQRWLVPTAVYDDGRFTYIRMPGTDDMPTADFPAVFARERADAEDFVVNTTVERGTLVVHGTYPYLVLRQGSNVVGLRRSATP